MLSKLYPEVSYSHCEIVTFSAQVSDSSCQRLVEASPLQGLSPQTPGVSSRSWQDILDHSPSTNVTKIHKIQKTVQLFLMLTSILMVQSVRSASGIVVQAVTG